MGNGRTILHVDDDPAVRHLVERRLAAAGYQVMGLDDPEQAIAALVDNDCRVVILDVDMPATSGLELLTRIKQFDEGIQVIMLTGLVSIDTVLESMRRGAEACLFKPLLDLADLISVLQAAFQKLDRWWLALADLNRRRTAERQNSDRETSVEVAPHDHIYSRSI
jgi:DNA-binding NtrC family response regulator